MKKRRVTEVTLTYDDGEVKTFQTSPEGHHVQRQNYDKGAKLPHEGWTSHEVSWSER